MIRKLSLIALFAAPLLLLVGALASGRIDAPGLGFGRPVLTLTLPPAGGVIGLPPIKGPLDASRPLVVIDAGHGGHDPGAQNGAFHEKAITLGLALALRDALLDGGGIRVALTRDDDRYLALQERSGIARQLGADLFVSIHADSAGGPGGASASGATVYTLSARGSSDEATRLASSENAADQVNGVALKNTGGEVSAILVDLAQRQSGTQARELSDIILREGRGTLNFRPQPAQSAAFVVLKSPDVPSILFEAGYVSNPQDAARLMSPEGRATFAQVTARAIRIWLARHSGNAAVADTPAPVDSTAADAPPPARELGTAAVAAGAAALVHHERLAAHPPHRPTPAAHPVRKAPARRPIAHPAAHKPARPAVRARVVHAAKAVAHAARAALHTIKPKPRAKPAPHKKPFHAKPH